MNMGSAAAAPAAAAAAPAAPATTAVRVVGAELGSARGLAVAAMMGQREMPWQRWQGLANDTSHIINRVVDRHFLS